MIIRETLLLTPTIIRRRVNPSLVPTRRATRWGGRGPAVVCSGLTAPQRGRESATRQGARLSLQQPLKTIYACASGRLIHCAAL